VYAACTQQARESSLSGASEQQLGAENTSDVTATSSQLLLEPVVSAAESIALLAAAAANSHDSMDLADNSSDSAAAAAAEAVKDEVAVAVAVLEQEELQPLEVEATEPQAVVLDPVALGLIQVLRNFC
jgi:hypothetical protein